MTYGDVLIQTMAELTGEPEEEVAGFIKQWNKKEPKKILNQKLTPPEAESLRVTFREGAQGPIANLLQEAVASFRAWRRENRYNP